MNTVNANEVVRSLGAIEQFATAIADKKPGSREARHDVANALQLCELFRLEARNHTRSDEILEKVAKLRRHLCALAGEGEPDNYTRGQHHIWVLEAVSALRAPLTRCEPKGP